MNVEQFDNELFNLSQQADEANAMPFNEEAWQRMEQLLDGDKKKRRLVLWWWLLPLLLVGGISALYFKSSKSNSKAALENTKTKEQALIANNIENKTLKKVDTLDQDLTKTADNKSSKEVDKVAEEANVINENKLTKQYISQPNVSVKAINKKNVTVAFKGKKSNNLNTKEILITNNNRDVIILDLNKNSGDKSAVNDLVNADNKLGKLENNKSDTIGSNQLVITTDNSETKEGELKKAIAKEDTISKSIAKANTNKTKPSFRSKFEVSAFAAGDFTSTNLSLKAPKSMTFGIGLSYQLTKKLSIATGFGVSKKLYSADSADYKNQPWVTAAYKLKTVDANCLVYELPINLQYQFAQSKKNSWLAVGGISTYFMKSETYEYNYSYYNMPRKTSYLIEDKNNHLFSILNLAIGYRRQFNKQLSYQLSPFVKIPLTGIGEGKVNLYSAGLQFSINLKGK